MYQYIKDPLLITQSSFEQIRELTNLNRFEQDFKPIAMRLVHTCGNPSIVNNLEVFGDVVKQGIKAIQQQSSVLCDVEMVRSGLSKKYSSVEPKCFLNEVDVATIAKSLRETRSMVAVKYWQPYLKDAIIVVGNAPTALFRCLEILVKGSAKPALIIGMPVGFVGAAESKYALMDYAMEHNVAAITLMGRAGGSALAVATYNAIAMAAADSVSFDGYT